MSFNISSDNYSLNFELNCKLEKLLEIPMNKTIDFSDYILRGIYLEVHDSSEIYVQTNIKITRYLNNNFIIFLAFFADYSFDDDYSGIIEITFNLDDYLNK